MSITNGSSESKINGRRPAPDWTKISKHASTSQGAPEVPPDDIDFDDIDFEEASPPDKGRGVERPARVPPLAKLLDDIVAGSRRFLHMQEWERHMLALWIVYTHGYDGFDHAPLLGLHSPVPGCGKTDAMRFMEPLVQRGTLEVSPTRATLFREIEQDHPTLLLDEMDKAQWPQIRDIINSGFTRGAKVPRCVGEDNVVEHFRPFGPKAIATMGKELPADTGDRALMVRLKKKPPSVKLEQLKMALHEGMLKELGAQAAAWVKQNGDKLPKCAPKMPSIVQDRGENRWLPLFTIAELAGGPWPERASTAATQHEQRKGHGDQKLTLLSHISELLKEWPSDELITAKRLCGRLNEREDWPWGGYSDGAGLKPNALGSMLKQLDIISLNKMWCPKDKCQVRPYSREQIEAQIKLYVRE